MTLAAFSRRSYRWLHLHAQALALGGRQDPDARPHWTVTRPTHATAARGKARVGDSVLEKWKCGRWEAYGAAHISRELLTAKSDDVDGRDEIHQAIAKGEPGIEPACRSFNVPVRECGSRLDVESMKRQKPQSETSRSGRSVSAPPQNIGARFTNLLNRPSLGDGEGGSALASFEARTTVRARLLILIPFASAWRVRKKSFQGLLRSNQARNHR